MVSDERTSPVNSLKQAACSEVFSGLGTPGLPLLAGGDFPDFFQSIYPHAETVGKATGTPPGWVVTFTVEGIPVPQGSKRLARGRIIDANPKALKEWRANVRTRAVVAKSVIVDLCPYDGPIQCVLLFRFQKPKSARRESPYTRPDLDKLVRAVLDSVTEAGIWRDDSRVTSLAAIKQYGLPGVTVHISPASDYVEWLHG